MCQLKADCPENYRCESDTSKNRTLRRKANALREKHGNSVLPPANVPPNKPKPLPDFKQWRVNRLVTEINQLVPDVEHDVLDMPTKNLISSKTVQLGATLIEMAETRVEYPAPTQEDFNAAYPTEVKLIKAQKALENYTEMKNKSLDNLHNYGYDTDSKTLKKLIDNASSLPKGHMLSIRKYALAMDRIDEAEKTLTKLSKHEDIVQDADGVLHYLKSRELLFRDRKIAIINTLKEIGVEFSDGNLIYSRSIKNEDYLAAQNVIHAAMLFPKEWIENSDKKQLKDGLTLHPMAIGSTVDDRPYYWAEGEDDYTKKIPKTEVVEKAYNWKPVPLTKEAHELKPIGLPVDGKVQYRKTSHEYIPPFENSEGQLVNPRPAGEGWEQKDFYENDDPTKEVTTYWTRPLLEDTDETERTSRAQVVTQPYYDGKTNTDRGESVAAHELFHRVTDSTHTLRQKQMAFLHTRAKLGTSQEEPFSYIYPWDDTAKDEVGYPASFNLGYAGKEYENGDNEIGTIGIESLFFGSHGGFIAGDNDKADPEYYAFIVGMIATSIDTK